MRDAEPRSSTVTAPTPTPEPPKPEPRDAAAFASPLEPTWHVRPPAPPAAVDALMRSLSVPPLLASVLWARGLHDASPEHLQPPLEPSRIPDLDAAAERLEDTIRHRRRILVHGDYDADGITGTAILTLGLRELGADVTPYLPNRLTDGYGVHPERVPEHIERADLFLTVDCGVSNLAEIAALQAAGVEVIVTDHHSPGDTLPDCLVVHPSTSPLAREGLPELTGAGVAFHLLWALRRRLGMDAPLDYADLAALGTIADVAPLLGENRALVVEGLKRITASRWPGVRASLTQAHLRGEVTARSVAFVLAPRLNAAGRLGEAEVGLELLTTASERRASELAAYLDTRNGDRRKLQDRMLAEAHALVDPEAPAIVVNNPDWHPGVMGIVASKLLERYYRPVYIVAKGKGSVRSTPGISAVNGLRAARRHLLRFGGHEQAAGFALDMAQLPDFREAICAYAAGFPPPQPTVLADAVIGPREVDTDLWKAIQGLEPFGEGHPAPVFALTDVLESARAVGKERNTLQLRVGGLKGVAWQMGALASALPVGAPVNAAASLSENEWQGSRTLEFTASSVRPARAIGFGANARAHEQAQARSDDPADGRSEARAPAGTRRVLRAAASLKAGVDAGTEDAVGDDAAADAVVAGGEFGSVDAGSVAARDVELGSVEVESVEDLQRGLSGRQPLRITSFPQGQALAMLRRALADPAPGDPGPSALRFDLDAAALSAIEAEARGHPTVGELRQAFLAVRRALPLPFHADKNARVMQALKELELVDATGRAMRRQKRDPYTSDTLRQGLVARYQLLTFVNAYRYFDDDAFAATVRTLFAVQGETPQGSTKAR